jgi:serine/threonine protein kinase
LLTFSGFSEGSELSERDEISPPLSNGSDNEFQIIVKSNNLSACIANCHFMRTVELVMNMRHPCIAAVIGVLFPSRFHKLQIVRLFCGGTSLSHVVSTSPEWWTPTAKAKTIVGLVLGMRFAHSFGLLHGHLTGNNILFDGDGMIQISDFCLSSLREQEEVQSTMAEVGGFSGEIWTPKADVQAFFKLLSDIVIGISSEHGGHGREIPLFISEMIEKRRSADLKAIESFIDIFEALKRNKFRIMHGVNIEEVSNFVSWIEWSEALIT